MNKKEENGKFIYIGTILINKRDSKGGMDEKINR